MRWLVTVGLCAVGINVLLLLGFDHWSVVAGYALGLTVALVADRVPA